MRLCKGTSHIPDERASTGSKRFSIRVRGLQSTAGFQTIPGFQPISINKTENHPKAAAEEEKR